MVKRRTVVALAKSRPVREGAGVHLKRAFPSGQFSHLDPFLLLDDFHSNNPDEYRMGFPWHPHRGIETITYVLQGAVEHGDSMGNRGVIGPGDVQWMSAGSGIVHQEMPTGQADGTLWGFQLWANLPAASKMTPPRYREIQRAQIPMAELENGVRVRVISGLVGGVRGPVRDVVTSPEYLDVTVPSHATFAHRIAPGHTAFAYGVEGSGVCEPEPNTIAPETLVVFGDGEELVVKAGDGGARFLLVSGQPIGEPIAWRGPIVMNTQDELRQALEELEQGTFLKDQARHGSTGEA